MKPTDEQIAEILKAVAESIGPQGTSYMNCMTHTIISQWESIRPPCPDCGEVKAEPTAEEVERAEFEEWARKKHRSAYFDRVNGQYTNADIDGDWETWKAARAGR